MNSSTLNSLLSSTLRSHFATLAGMATFGERLKRLREERGWSQADLASKMQVTEGAVRQYEAGTIGVSLKRGMRLAKLLNEPLAWLVYGEGERAMQPVASSEKAAHSGEALPAILSGFQTQLDDLRKAIVEAHPELKRQLEPQAAATHKTKRKRPA